MANEDKDDNEDEPLSSTSPQAAPAVPCDRSRAEQELSEARQELRQKGQELARSAASLRAALEATTDALLVLSADNAVLHLNDNFRRMWQPLPPCPLSDGRVFAELCQRAAQPERFRERLAVIAAEQPDHTFDLLELADDRVIECHSRLRVVDGVGDGRVWSFRDITESRRNHEQLQQETRVLALLNSTGRLLASQLDLPSLLQTVTNAGTALSTARFGAFLPNPACTRWEALSPRAVSGALGNWFAEIVDPGAIRLFETTFKGGPPVRSDDVRRDPRWASLSDDVPARFELRSYLAVPLVSRGGEVLGGLFFGDSEPARFDERVERIIMGVASQAAISIDNARLYEAAQRASVERQSLLERERSAREAAERLSALKDEFLASLSHELRTPLNAILGWAEILQHGQRPQNELERGLATIERNARIQAQLVDDLLDMSRIASGKLRLDVQSLEPIDFIEAAADTLRPAASAKGIRIEMPLESRVAPVLGDPNRLQQVMWNLLSNAIKFTPKGGKVQIAVEQARSHIEIRVTDTGIGISAEFLPHVFDRFRQANAGIARRHGGLGLGLSIVQHLVELHGGAIRAESSGPGQGATFSVQLPVAALHVGKTAETRTEPGSTSPAADEQPVSLAGVRVLVVEDDADSRDLLQRILERCAANVVTASSAAEGLALMNQDRPDILVSDIGMPEVDGFEFLRRVRASEGDNARRVPAIALTAYARVEDRTRVLKAGFQAHLGKPVHPSELVATVASITGRLG